MAFDIEKFETATLTHRVSSIKVPAMKEFFDGAPEWEIRGLSGEEVAKVNEAVKLNANLAGLIEGFASGETGEKITAIKESLGITEEVPHETVRRIALLKVGSVNPECSQSVCVKVAEGFPVQFYEITTKILELTGMGSTVGEQNASGQMKESE